MKRQKTKNPTGVRCVVMLRVLLLQCEALLSCAIELCCAALYVALVCVMLPPSLALSFSGSALPLF